jgi:DNA-binding NtrC family response regulator
MQVLLIDDDPFILRLAQRLLERSGFDVVCVESGVEGLRKARNFHGVVVLDLNLPDLSGRQILSTLTEEKPDLPVIVLTGSGDTDIALGVLQAGSFEYLDKDHLATRLVTTVQAAADHLGDGETSQYGITGESAVMRRMFAQLAQAAQTKLPVLIRGESGVGKELVARAVHEAGPRAHRPFIALNCAAIPATLLESELFGHERGAFTGAHRDKHGRFEQAEGGTLFLDEIGDMPADLQSKILRIVQEGTYQRVGGTQTLRTDVRLVSATHRDLEERAAAGDFREDLLFRLAVFTLEVPPLRDRLDDVPLLVEHFLLSAQKETKREVTAVDSRAMELLCAHSYPGNVRELENIVYYGAARAHGDTLTLGVLPKRLLAAQKPVESTGGTDAPEPIAADGRFLTLAEVEQAHIDAAVARAKGNKTLAAKLLGISRMKLYRRLGDEPDED